MIGFAAYWLFFQGESDEDMQARIASEQIEAAELERNKEKGFHCLSGWNGAQPSVVAEVKMHLRDPGSFEHISTSVLPINENGDHEFVMEYRAENGFGGESVGHVMGTYSNSNCRSVKLILVD